MSNPIKFAFMGRPYALMVMRLGGDGEPIGNPMYATPGDLEAARASIRFGSDVADQPAPTETAPQGAPTFIEHQRPINVLRTIENNATARERTPVMPTPQELFDSDLAAARKSGMADHAAAQFASEMALHRAGESSYTRADLARAWSQGHAASSANRFMSENPYDNHLNPLPSGRPNPARNEASGETNKNT